MNNPFNKNDNRLLVKICQESFNQISSSDVYLSVTRSDLEYVVGLLPDMGISLIGLFAVEKYNGFQGLTLFYVLEKRGSRNIVILLLKVEGDSVLSVAKYFPSASWFEREIQDGFGLYFETILIHGACFYMSLIRPISILSGNPSRIDL
jgi:Ni,Fe-hydrogenase III component G